MTLAIVLSIIFAVLLLILFIPIGIGVKYDESALFLVRIAVFSFSFPLRLKVKKGKKKKDANTSTDKAKTEEEKGADEIKKSALGLDFILDLLGDFRVFVRKGLFLKEFKLKIDFGVSDAAATAVTVGALWGAAYALLALVERLFTVKKPEVDVIPRFNEDIFRMTAQGIIVTNLAHIIAVALILVYKYLKYKKCKRRTNK